MTPEEEQSLPAMADSQAASVPPVEPTTPMVPQPTPELPKPSFLGRFWYLLVTGIAILALAVFLGVSYFQAKSSSTQETGSVTPVVTPMPAVEADTQTELLQEQGSSDEVSAIEADLEKTDLSGLDKEVEDIESELVTP